MISFFRNALTSWWVLGLFALILIAFIVTGFGSGGQGGIGNLALGGDAIARVGSTNVSGNELSRRIQQQFEAEREKRPTLTKAQFIEAGAFDQQLDQLVIEAAIDQFMAKEGVTISARMIDRELDKVPAFKGPTGKFSPEAFQDVLRANGLTEEAVRQTYARQLYGEMLATAATIAPHAPSTITRAYASLLFERREGQAALFPVADFAGAPPSDAEVEAWYKSNLARYTVPETRTIRYAAIDPTRFVGKVAPNDAEILAAYKAQTSKFARSEQRVVTQAIVPDANAAKALVAASSGGNFVAAARAAKSQATTLKLMDEKGYSAIATSPGVAAAAFKANQGEIVNAGKSALGWHVVRVDQVVVKEAKTLEQARAELLPELTKRKEAEALQDFIVKLEAAADDGQSLADIATANGLQMIETPAITPGGVAPGLPGFKLDPKFAAVLKEGFQADEGDDPLTVTLDAKTGESAMIQLARIFPPRPAPFNQIRGIVASDLIADRASKAAKKTANAVLTKINKGMAFNAALASEKRPPARPLSAPRNQMLGDPTKLPAGLVALFELSRGKARLVELADKGGYGIVVLDRIVPGDPNADREAYFQFSEQLKRQSGSEYADQFLRAVSGLIGTQRDAQAIDRIRKSLVSPSGQ